MALVLAFFYLNSLCGQASIHFSNATPTVLLLLVAAVAGVGGAFIRGVRHLPECMESLASMILFN